MRNVFFKLFVILCAALTQQATFAQNTDSIDKAIHTERDKDGAITVYKICQNTTTSAYEQLTQVVNEAIKKATADEKPIINSAYTSIKRHRAVPFMQEIAKGTKSELDLKFNKQDNTYTISYQTADRKYILSGKIDLSNINEIINSGKMKVINPLNGNLRKELVYCSPLRKEFNFESIYSRKGTQ